MTTSNATNGRPQRKQLADQLDRFDKLLDGLSEGLMGAITDAVRDGTRLAVKDAIIEILTDPTLRGKLHQAAAPAAGAASACVESRPSFWSRVKGAATTALAAGRAVLTAAGQRIAQAATTLAVATSVPLRLIQLVGNLNRLLMVAAGAGLAIAAISYFVPHVICAALSGLAGGFAAMAVQAPRWTRRTINALSLT